MTLKLLENLRIERLLIFDQSTIDSIYNNAFVIPPNLQSLFFSHITQKLTKQERGF